MAKDIENIEDIRLMVDTFYSRVRENEILGPIFREKIGDDWDPHLEKMYKFWQTAALKEHTYMGNPFMAHVDLPVERKHFDEWLRLFNLTLDELFKGNVAEEVRKRASFMAGMFHSKISHIRKSSQ